MQDKTNQRSRSPGSDNLKSDIIGISNCGNPSETDLRRFFEGFEIVVSFGQVI